TSLLAFKIDFHFTDFRGQQPNIGSDNDHVRFDMSRKVASDKRSRHDVQFLARSLPFLRGRPQRHCRRCFAPVACPNSCAPCSSNTSIRSAAVADRKWINVEGHSASNNSLPQQARLLLVVVTVSCFDPFSLLLHYPMQA